MGGLINLKYIPSVKKDSPPDVKQLTLLKSEKYKTTQVRLGEATLEFYSSYYNPLDKIPILEIKDAGCLVNSFNMTYGEVLYDYLKNDK